jgi:REP element-mobilizing transposase RayT
MTTQSYRRARHSVSLLHAHLVFVTKYRRPVFTDAMLTFCEHTMRTVCTEIDTELVEINGDADHVHLLVAYPPTLAISTRCRGAMAARLTPCAANTPVLACAPACADISGRRLLRRLLPPSTAVDPQAIHRRPSPTTMNAGLHPRTDRWANPALNCEARAQDSGQIDSGALLPAAHLLSLWRAETG